ncbi:MAG: phage tail assembly chaperone [Sphingopyxis sp.]|uniref:phage tail assembly chaperone n=1 Tax=Sphingopyxis sp. TaxID=1908224 RepID=UPI001A3144CF|nr:phage tail assembly chaperone [Sphingopyxis sp.]MBJ7501794.1 phage tail assembly chaperone [Sphingopyxis sp.]
MAHDRLEPAAIALAGVMARVAGWRPDEFWMATPADVRATLEGWVDADGHGGVDGAALAAMMERFPDG